MFDFFKNIKVILISLLLLSGIIGSGWLYVSNLKSTINSLEEANKKLVQDAIDEKTQHELSISTLRNKTVALEALSTGLSYLKVNTVTVKEYVQVYKNNPANNTPCLRSEWMHTYNRAVQAAYDGFHRP